ALELPIQNPESKIIQRSITADLNQCLKRADQRKPRISATNFPGNRSSTCHRVEYYRDVFG
ncbi:hypothetical protein BDR06DRAFT_1020576, partial [Suillus hirtellus]